MPEFLLAQKKELPKLTKLWQVCFGDAPKEIDRFWSALFDKIQVFTAWEQETPVSMLCALPLRLVNEMGESFPAAYLYAVCTAPKYRKQGLCAKLMAFAEAALKKEGIMFSCLVPSEESLFSFYEKLDYKTAFYHKSYAVSAKKDDMKIAKIGTETYQNLRQMQLYGDFADYDLSLLSWQQTISEAGGGGLFRLETADGVYCAAVEKHSDILHIKELLPDCPDAAAALASHLFCKEAHVRAEGQKVPFGMAKALFGSPVPKFSYLAFAFD